MATVLARPTESKQSQTTHSALKAFLNEMSELSRRHGIAIGDGATLYVMEGEDYARSYLTSEESELTFA